MTPPSLAKPPDGKATKLPDQMQQLQVEADNIDEIRNIDPEGDVVLLIQHETETVKHEKRFRVASSRLQTSSKYFSSLLSGRFGESDRIHKRHAVIKEKVKSIAEAPSSELPVIKIVDVGRISAVKSIEPLCTDLLLILHGADLQTPTPPPVANLANLATVADRFDALDALRNHVHRKRYLRAIDGKGTPKLEASLSEEKVRQRVLISLLLDTGPWLEKYSLRLITKGWVDRQVSDTAPLWRDLPSTLEEELAFRRECVLETLQSLQTHSVGLYTSRERQCRLGYENSAQCDSFQLGEMIRFLSRIGTLQARGSILDTSEYLEPYDGDVYNLIDDLRKAPEYQIDRYHTHCGIRTKLIPLLDLVTESLQHTGVCSECWSENRIEQSWSKSKRPLMWKRSTFRSRNLSHKDLHANIKALFMAEQRDWSS